MAGEYTLKDFEEAGYAKSKTGTPYKVIDTKLHKDGTKTLMIENDIKFQFPAEGLTPITKEEYEKWQMMRGLK